VIAPAAADYFYKNKFRACLVEVMFSVFKFERLGNFIRGLNICKELLKKGKAIVLFPEGTRVNTEDVGEFKPGVGALAYELNIPIVPVYIFGASQALAKGGFIIRPVKVKVIIGEPVYPQGENNYQNYFKISKKVREEIIKLRSGN
jgi:1-acyl-sn-glycerol-3-phosphate acyltransferase